jgi:hypothetical protein
VGDGRGQLAGLAGADGELTAFPAGETTAGVHGGDGGESGGVGTQGGQQNRGDRAAGRQPNQVEAEGRGTDQ